jgi:Trk K+ transport system NAD-binding subunit
MFQRLEPELNHSLPEATYYTWSLVFGEPPEAFPRPVLLQALFFIVPVLGLTVIIEGVVDFSMMVRDRRRNERGWCSMMASSLRNHIVLVGFGRLGFRTFFLLRDHGEEVVVIERDADNEFLEEVRRDGSPLFIGDARREALLEEANIAQARSIILATNDDLANLEIALDARKISPTIRVVLRMFDQNMADKIRDGFNIHIAMSESAISAPAFATAAMEPSILSSLVVSDQLVVMKRWHVREGGPLCSKTVGHVLVELGFGVVERRAKSGAAKLFPHPDTRLEPGDELLVQGPFESLKKLKRTAAGLA